MHKKILLTLAMSSLLLGPVSVLAAQPNDAKTAVNTGSSVTLSSAKPDVAKAIAALGKVIKEKFPQNPEPKSIAATQVPGIFELLLDDQITYVDSTGTFFFFNAAMVDLKNQVNMTSDRLNDLLKIDTGQLDRKDAIVHKKGTGKHQLYVFSDPYCSYCQQLEKELTKLDDVTIITFMIPRPDARTVAQSIWCAPKQQETWDSYMATRTAPAVKTCDSPIDRNIALSKKLNVNGTPAMFAADGRRIAGYVPAEKIKTFLGQSAPQQ